RPNGGTRALPEPMVRCAECGVHAPKGDAVAAGGEYFCSTEHAQRHGARASGHDAR
ncbi:PP0621 family protein, partial [Burkholderia ambifaria]|uniref:PP0621 family protein n=1 Tax=Burkholderia ambifaria TaxID=152480 RepID=UPI000550ECAC